ncbi:MAG TPA: OsmC family protein [Gemmatimonadales bacterium]|nr:OsmC family protein [Gemmatimonadales bacterium]
MTRLDSEVAAWQDPLRAGYRDHPADAAITDAARTWDDDVTDPWHVRTVPGDHDYGVAWTVGTHRAVGGHHDAPNPGDMLSAALAVCLDSAIRLIANRWGVTLTTLAVRVESDVDVRGTLMVDPSVPVGFQRMRCAVTLETAPGTPPEMRDKLFAAGEHCCVNLQTLRAGVPVETTLISPSDSSPPSPRSARSSRFGSLR